MILGGEGARQQTKFAFWQPAVSTGRLRVKDSVSGSVLAAGGLAPTQKCFHGKPGFGARRSWRGRQHAWLVEFCCRRCVLMLLVAEQRNCYLQRASSGLEQRESKGGEGEEGESGGVTNDVREDVIWPPTHA